MVKKKIRQDDSGNLIVEPTKRLALLWSYDPLGDYPHENMMVGSVLAHKGHIERHGGVYWGLVFKVGKQILDEFKYPMSGYLYNSSTGIVEYRVRIVDISAGSVDKWTEYIPIWRSIQASDKRLLILIDQIDEIFPVREINEFAFFTTGKKVESPPHGNYLKIHDPLY